MHAGRRCPISLTAGTSMAGSGITMYCTERLMPIARRLPCLGSYQTMDNWLPEHIAGDGVAVDKLLVKERTRWRSHAPWQAEPLVRVLALGNTTTSWLQTGCRHESGLMAAEVGVRRQASSTPSTPLFILSVTSHTRPVLVRLSGD